MKKLCKRNNILENECVLLSKKNEDLKNESNVLKKECEELNISSSLNINHFSRVMKCENEKPTMRLLIERKKWRNLQMVNKILK